MLSISNGNLIVLKWQNIMFFSDKKYTEICSQKDKPYGNCKASYISVLDHWKTLETTFTMESNERNQMTDLQSYNHSQNSSFHMK